MSAKKCKRNSIENGYLYGKSADVSKSDDNFFLLLSMLSVYNQFISHAGVEGGGKNKIPGQQYKLPPPPTQPSNVHKKSKPG